MCTCSARASNGRAADIALAACTPWFHAIKIRRPLYARGFWGNTSNGLPLRNNADSINALAGPELLAYGRDRTMQSDVGPMMLNSFSGVPTISFQNASV